MYKNLVIVGGGFAGTKTAQLLEHTLPPDWTLTLVSQENFITFNPLLPEVVGASIMPSHVIAPHRQMLHCSATALLCPTEVLGLKVSGFIAWLMWRGLYLLRIPTLARKTRLFLEWN